MLVWKAHKSKLRSLAFSPDGRFISSTAGTSKYVCLWDATSGKLVRKFSNEFYSTRLAGFHPDGRHLIGIHEARGGSVWEIETGQRAALLDANTWQYSDTMAISPANGRVVFHVSAGMSEWEDTARPSEGPRPCDRTRPFPMKLGFQPLRLAYSPSGRYLCVMERNLTLLNPVTLREGPTLVDRGGANASGVAFSADESQLAVAFGHRVEIWRKDQLNEQPVTLRGHSLLVRAVGFLPGGATVMTAGMDGTARLWDANTGAETRAFDWGIGKVRVAAVSPHGLTCAAGGESGQIVLWDVDS